MKMMDCKGDILWQTGQEENGEESIPYREWRRKYTMQRMEKEIYHAENGEGSLLCRAIIK